jgi:hypothetical protein
VDFNTNDEQEDSWAEAKNWDFKYGRTAYGFLNIAVRPGPNGENIIIDSNVTNPATYDGHTIIVQSRPIWMDNSFLNKYDSDNVVDPFGSDFTVHGQLNIRIDSTLAYHMLTPTNQYNGAMNTDTLMTVVVNDGHGGLNKMDLPVFVNIEPIILTTSLPNAKEDYEYNPQLLDSARMIKIFDPNFQQYHTFEVLYPTSRNGQDQIWRDPCFPTADPTNFWDISKLKTTPDWFRINKESGLCYGKPGVIDAPRTDTITVIVTDDDGLTKIQTYTLFVDSTNHLPRITQVPNIKCVEQGKPYDDYIVVTEHDLLRINAPETITITILPPVPVGMTVTPSTVTGPRSTDTVHVHLHADNFKPFIEQDGKATIKIQVTDAAGNSDTLWYRVKVSDPTDFVCPLIVRNNQGAFQILEFGTGVGATTGEALDPTDGPLGKLDSNFCEYELPPLPQTDIFDSRWDISSTNGILRNIFPRGDAQHPGTVRVYKGEFQSGGENGNTSNHYPVTISWSPSTIPAKDDQTLNPSGASWRIKDAVSNGNIFNYNMKTGTGVSESDIKFTTVGDRDSLSINKQSIKSFIIEYDWTSGVNDSPNSSETKIISAMPNPFDKSTEITFGINSTTNVTLDVMDALGNTVATLTDAIYNPGKYTLVWDGRDMSGKELASGAYICRMVAGSYTSTEKLVIIR